MVLIADELASAEVELKTLRDAQEKQKKSIADELDSAQVQLKSLQDAQEKQNKLSADELEEHEMWDKFTTELGDEMYRSDWESYVPDLWPCEPLMDFAC
jgi:hypothetical protein